MKSCFCLSSVGKKVLMALSGLALVGFIVGHLLGNLTIFGGPDLLNAYAKKLQSLGPLLWVARISLLAFVAIHIVTAIQLTVENRAARPQAYAKKKNQSSTYASRTMPMSGIIILAFIIFHLAHFTFKVTHPEFSHYLAHNGYHDVYAMVVLSFQSFWVSASYVIAITLLCMHLSHGLWSMFQSLGLLCDKGMQPAKLIARGIAGLIYIGYISIPLACYFGFVKVTVGAH